MTGPRVLFVCVRNGGKSQMAAGLMRSRAGDAVEVTSAGTSAGTKLNAQSVQALLEVDVDITGAQPQQLTQEMVREADLVVILGTEAHVETASGTPIEIWETDEPSHRGIEGLERMRLIRDDITARIDDLTRRLAPTPGR